MKLLRLLFIVFFIHALCIGVAAAENETTATKVKDGAKSAWQDFKKAAKDTGKAFKDGAEKAGDKGKQAYDGTKKAVTDVVQGETEKTDP